MSHIWSIFVGSLQIILVALSQIYGGNIGFAIITFSFIVRLALMPLTLQIARRSQRQQSLINSIQPELQRLKTRYRNNPEQLSLKTMELYKKHGINPLDGIGILGSLLQLPVFAGLFSAIRQGIGSGDHFLWISDISQPNIVLSIAIAVLTLITSALSPSVQQQSRTLFLILPTALTLLFVWQLSAGLGLYWTASSIVGVIQAAIMRRKAT
jgi:YidC/Oxa1 family membrane protein insertase